MTTYFTDNSFKYLQELAHHNDKIWFTAHKPQYIEHVQTPFLRLITDLQPCLADISEHYHADPRPQGGSLFRIYRDARFSKDKSPYKTWQGARLFHARRREVPTPPFTYNCNRTKASSVAEYGNQHQTHNAVSANSSLTILPVGTPLHTTPNDAVHLPCTKTKNSSGHHAASPAISPF